MSAKVSSPIQTIIFASSFLCLIPIAEVGTLKVNGFSRRVVLGVNIVHAARDPSLRRYSEELLGTLFSFLSNMTAAITSLSAAFRNYEFGCILDGKVKKRYFWKLNGSRLQEEELDTFAVALVDLAVAGQIFWPKADMLVDQFRALPTNHVDTVPWNYMYGPDGVFSIDVQPSSRQINYAKVEEWLYARESKPWTETDFQRKWAVVEKRRVHSWRSIVRKILPAPFVRILLKIKQTLHIP